MKHQPNPRDAVEQARQRIRVGMIGLAAVVLLIGLASAIFSTVTRDRPVAVNDPARDMAAVHAGKRANASASGNEPLAELGVTPSIGNSTAAAGQP